MQGRAKVHEKQANRRRSEKLRAAQSVHAWSRSTAYTYPQCSVLCRSVHGRAKVQNCIGRKRMRCFQAARARDERSQRQRFAAVLACRNVAANRRVLALVQNY